MAPPANPNFDAGTMLAVKGDAEQLQQEIRHLPDVTIANLNSSRQVILAGPKVAMKNAQQYLEEKGYFVTPLPVSAAFHTSLVGHAQQPFAQDIERTIVLRVLLFLRICNRAVKLLYQCQLTC